MTLISFDKTKIICRAIIVVGVIILLYGLWQYMPRGFSSETPDVVFWEIVSKRIAYPLCGIILIVMGSMLLRIIQNSIIEPNDVKTTVTIDE